jgi:diguanylate cyclase (GGDEF)-like protein
LVIVKVENVETPTHAGTANDLVLTFIGELIGSQVRDADLVARYSSDAFAILLPDAGQIEAKSVCERLLAAWSENDVCSRTQLSVGWSSSPEHGALLEDLIQAATFGSFPNDQPFFESQTLTNRVATDSLTKVS